MRIAKPARLHILIPFALITLYGFASSDAAAQQPSVLVCGEGSSQNIFPGWLDSVQSWLEATGRFSTVDTHDAVDSAPPLALLESYDAVLVFLNSQTLHRVEFGNNLAAYVDGGGGVVECQAMFTDSWGLLGSWTSRTSIGRTDDILTDAQSLGNVLVVRHPILMNITSVDNGFVRNPGTVAANGATVIAEWTDGTVLLAANESFPGRVAAVNIMPITTATDPRGFNTDTTDTDELIADALVWAANLKVAIVDPEAGALPSGEAGNPWTAVFVASGGSEPYTWSFSGTLPPGLSLDPATGELAGVPTTAGSYTFDITVTDQVPNADTRTYSIEIFEQLVIASPPAGALPDGALNSSYGPVEFQATGGGTPYTWSISSAPPGMTFDANTGVLSGTPTAAGSYSFDVTVTDDNGFVDTRSYTLEVIEVLAITDPPPGSLQPGYLGESYSVTFTATGGTPGYSWSLAGELPPGLMFDMGTGILSGTPTTEGTWTFTIAVTDQAMDMATREYSLQVVSAPSISSPVGGPLPDGTEAAPLSYGLPPVTFTVVDGAPAYVWSAMGLPAGLSIDPATSEITGTPATGTVGTYSISVTVTDAGGKQATADYTITINPPVAIVTSVLPDATELVGYRATVEKSGGTPAHSWTAVFDSALSGFSIDPDTGQISGTPELGTSGTYTVTVSCADQYGSTASVTLELAVKASAGSVGSPGGCSCRTTVGPHDREAIVGWLWCLLLLTILVGVRRRS